MPRRITDIDDPDRFAAVVHGEPEDGSFYLRATKGVEVAVVALEREQIQLLADRVFAVMDELERRGLSAIDASSMSGSHAAVGPPSTPAGRSIIDSSADSFHAGTLTIAWDEDVDRLIIEARSYTFDEGAGESATPALDEIDDEAVTDDAPIGPDVLRVHLRPIMAQGFARQARAVAVDPGERP